ncbi:hypothetical protein V6N13_057024 [Hibiscus sabdariffa]
MSNTRNPNKNPQGNSSLLPDETPMGGLLEPLEASHCQIEQLVHVSSMLVLEREGSPFPADEIQTSRRVSPPVPATPVVDGVQGVTETQSYVGAVVEKDTYGSGECFTVSNDDVLVSDEDVQIMCDVETRCRRYKRLEEVAPHSHENAKVATAPRSHENAPMHIPGVAPRQRMGKHVSAWRGNGKNDLVSSSSVASVSSEGSLQGIGSKMVLGKARRSKISQGLGVRKVLSVKKQTKLRLPSPHVLSKWIPTVSNSLSLRVVSSERTVTVIDPGEAVVKGLEGWPTAPRHLYFINDECLSLELSGHCQWALEGDRNTKFFPGYTMARRRNNLVRALRKNSGDWVTDYDELHNLAVVFYTKLFTREVSDGYAYSVRGNFSPLSAVEVNDLVRPISDE